MKIALLGYGRMGHMVEQLALAAGDSVVAIIDAGQENMFDTESFASADVAIDFSVPSVAYSLCRAAMQRGKPVVSGTTGWDKELHLLQQEIITQGWTFLHASNFSIGVNLFFALSEEFAKMMDRFHNYRATMKEVHHRHKLDAPSGTALTTAKGILVHSSRLSDWYMESEEPSLQSLVERSKDGKKPDDCLPIKVFRQGEEIGCHSVAYTSDSDSITLTHQAFDRSGFAQGALIAARFCLGRSGLFTMKQLLEEYR